MSTNLTIRQQLLEKFHSRKRRRAFAEQDLGTTVAAQIYALRQKADLTQDQLAKETDMSQARISVLENPNYRKFNVGTLQRIAAAFDVVLVVRFVSFGELLDWTVNGSLKMLAPPSFDEEFAEAVEDKLQSKVIPLQPIPDEPEIVPNGQALGREQDTQAGPILNFTRKLA